MDHVGSFEMTVALNADDFGFYFFWIISRFVVVNSDKKNVSSPMEQVCFPRIQGFKDSSANAKKLQRVESLTKVIRTLFRGIYNNSKIPKGRKIF